MPLQSTLTHPEQGLCLLSLDAGGARAISQLKVLTEVMDRLNFGANPDSIIRPCDVFDMIGGAGSGGFLAILLVIVKLNAEAAIEEFIDLSVNVLEKQDMDAVARTALLKQHISKLLERHHLDKSIQILGQDGGVATCKLVVPISYKSSVGSKCVIRNYSSKEEDLGFTVAEGLTATLATPPLFTPTQVAKNSAILEYIGADLMVFDPVQEVMGEAEKVVGSERLLACLLSIGCGHPGITAAPRGTDPVIWNEVVERLVKDDEQNAQRLEAQMGHLGIYHRLHVTRGLEHREREIQFDPGEIITHTETYLSDAFVSRKIDACVSSLKAREGVASLEQINRFGGSVVLSASLPPLTRTFVMRKEPWDFAEKALLGPRAPEHEGMQRMLVVTGIGGCGKTQLMLKFMHVHRSRFISLLFVDGSSESRIRADITRHVRSLDTRYSQMGFDDCLVFLAQPSPHGQRLILYDNVDDPDLDIIPLLPDGDACAITLTSRNRTLGSLSLDAHLELDNMATHEAVELLLYAPNRSGRADDSARKDATAIAEALDFLPIALQQARSYMQETRCSASGYLERLRTSRDKLLAQPVKYQREMRFLSTYAAFDASFQHLDLHAQQLLRLLSYFYWRKFPLELIEVAAKYGFSKYENLYNYHGEEHEQGMTALEDIFLQSGEWNTSHLDKLMVSLQSYSLATLTSGVDTILLEMHPLLHEWVYACIPQQERRRYESAAVVLLALGARSEHTSPKQYLASHVTHLSPIWNQLHVNAIAAFGQILSEAGVFEGALQLQEAVVRDVTIRPDVPRPLISIALWRLAETYQKAGRTAQSLLISREVLKLLKETLGEHHPDTISALNNLAISYSNLGWDAEALILWEEMLRARKESLGERHPETIMEYGNLANTLADLGRLDEAVALEEVVLRLQKEVWGERHPNTMIASGNLAVTYSTLGRHAEALPLRQDVERLTKEILGERHPHSIMASSNLAATYNTIGEYNQALVLQEHVLEMRRDVLGESHPDTLAASNNLANTYFGLGWFEKAQELQEETLQRRRELLGEHHPDTLATLNNIASTYFKLGRHAEALSLRKEVLRVRKEVLGERHFETLNAAEGLATFYNRLGHHHQALNLNEETLKMRQAVFGNRHPDTCRAMLNLAETYHALQRKSLALDLVKEAGPILLEMLGAEHPLYERCRELESRLQTLDITVSTPLAIGVE